MSNFHERLVEARREGTAAPQVDQMLAAGLTPVGAGGDDGDLWFTEPDDLGVPSVCSRCGAVVLSGLQFVHVKWHAEAQK